MMPISPAFVLLVHDEILHQTQVGRAGVDIARLESVLGRIEQQIHYRALDDVFEIAAWYGIAIAKGHAFTDGNKRTALSVMLAFLELQGISLATNQHLDDLMVDIVESPLEHEQLARAVSQFLYHSQQQE